MIERDIGEETDEVNQKLREKSSAQRNQHRAGRNEDCALVDESAFAGRDYLGFALSVGFDC